MNAGDAGEIFFACGQQQKRGKFSDGEPQVDLPWDINIIKVQGFFVERPEVYSGTLQNAESRKDVVHSAFSILARCADTDNRLEHKLPSFFFGGFYTLRRGLTDAEQSQVQPGLMWVLHFVRGRAWGESSPQDYLNHRFLSSTCRRHRSQCTPHRAVSHIGIKGEDGFRNRKVLGERYWLPGEVFHLGKLNLSVTPE